MGSTSAPPILVLQDLDTVKTELTIALECADQDQRAGLEKALRVVDRRIIVTDEQRIQEWVRRTVKDAGVDIARDRVLAVKALRQALPGLGLVTANGLVNSAK